MAKPLQKMTDPRCPGCGCNASTVIGRSTRWDTEAVRRRCDHCRKTWTTAAAAANGEAERPAKKPEVPDPDRGVIFFKIRCPVCGGDDCPVVHTAKPVRRHKCRACGHRFKSVER